MDFTQWLQAKGIDPASLSLNARLEAQAQWRAEQTASGTPPPAQPIPVPQATAQAPPPPTPTPQAASAPQMAFDERMAAIDAENSRQDYIRDMVTKTCEANLGNAEKCKQIRQLGEAAIADKTTTREKFQLAMLTADRYSGPVILAPRGGQDVTAEVLEAAVCSSQRLPNLEKRFSDQALQSAHSRFRRGLGLKQLIYLAAQRNDGYRGDFQDEEAMCRAAFRPRGFDGPMATVPSTIDVSGILSNVGNKFLAASFSFTEQSWREIARIRSANDFKQMTTYRLTSSTKFEKVAPGGEIRHGTLGELPYTNQIDTYGKLLGFDRRDLINDDLGALTGAATELARGAGDSLNEIFWTEFLDDSTFFPTDKSLGNYDDGATDSVLSLAGLENADTIFASQTKPDGTPLGVMPEILLVPRGLRATAMTLMSATGIVGQGFNAAAVPDGNPWAGMFKVVSSIYLANAALGGSATAWYLLSNPSNLAVIEVAFLFGRDTPIVESSEFDFNRLGMSWRAYMDWGVAKQEHRAGLKMKGSA